MALRMNEGYIITDSVHIGESEFVLGVSSVAPSMFVTWKCADGNNYYWGHYTTDQLAAMRDLLTRANEELELLEQRRIRDEQAREQEDLER